MRREFSTAAPDANENAPALRGQLVTGDVEKYRKLLSDQ
jgi:hypothetical protein